MWQLRTLSLHSDLQLLTDKRQCIHIFRLRSSLAITRCDSSAGHERQEAGSRTAKAVHLRRSEWVQWYLLGLSMCGSTHSDAYNDDYDDLDEDCQQGLDCRGEVCLAVLLQIGIKLTLGRL